VDLAEHGNAECVAPGVTYGAATWGEHVTDAEYDV
jgi:hypothetical protein